MHGFLILNVCQIGSFLSLLSFKYNDDLPFNTPKVIVSLVCAVLTFIIFIIVELRVAQEPILAPALLKMRVPVLVGMSNLLVESDYLGSARVMNVIMSRYPLPHSLLCTSFPCISRPSC